jgi:hypothetical protein
MTFLSRSPRLQWTVLLLGEGQRSVEGHSEGDVTKLPAVQRTNPCPNSAKDSI